MKVVSGRFREPRLYLIYAFSVLWPGMDLPTFSPQRLAGPDVEATDEDSLRLIIDEARRQLDRQQATLQHLQARASTLLTLVIAEIALIASTAQGVINNGPWAVAAVVVGFLLAALALGGTASIIASKAVLGAMDVTQLAPIKNNLLQETAQGYVQLMPPGTATNQARITVMRDAVLLAVLAAVVYAPAYAFMQGSNDTDPAPEGPPVLCETCPSISTPPSPAPLPVPPRKTRPTLAPAP